MAKAVRLCLFGTVGLVVAIKVTAAATDVATAFLRPAHDGQRVLAVIDGDTVLLSRPGFGAENARLIGFDTPELRSRCFREFWMAQTAKTHLHWLLWTSQEVEVHGSRRDRYGRPLVAMLIDGEKLAPMMIETGFARPYTGGIRQGWCA